MQRSAASLQNESKGCTRERPRFRHRRNWLSKKKRLRARSLREHSADNPRAGKPASIRSWTPGSLDRANRRSNSACHLGPGRLVVRRCWTQLTGGFENTLGASGQRKNLRVCNFRGHEQETSGAPCEMGPPLKHTSGWSFFDDSRASSVQPENVRKERSAAVFPIMRRDRGVPILQLHASMPP